MLKNMRRPAKLDVANKQFFGSSVLAFMPVLANFYVLVILPFLEEGPARIFNHLFWIVTAAVTLVLLFQNRSRLDWGFLRSLPMMSLAAYFLFAAASITWAYSPEYTVSRLAVQILAAIIIILPYALPIRSTYNMQAIFVCYLIAFAMSAFYVLTTKPSALGHAGFFTHKQELGVLCAVGLILSVHELRFRGWRRLISMLAMSAAFWMLLESQSKSNLAISLFSVAFAGITLLACKYMKITPAYFVAACVVGSFFIDDPMGRLGYRFYGDVTLTGRTAIWEFIEYQISRKAWFGWGFQSYWFVPNSPHIEAVGFVRDMPSSHSGYLELKLETGRIGYWIFLVFLYATLHAVDRVRRVDFARAWLYLSVLSFALLINLLDSGWFLLNNLWILYLVVVAETVHYSRLGALNANALRRSRRRRIGQPSTSAV